MGEESIFPRGKKHINRQTKNPTTILNSKICKWFFILSLIGISHHSGCDPKCIHRTFSKISANCASQIAFSWQCVRLPPEENFRNSNTCVKKQCTCIENNSKAKQVRWMVLIHLFNKQKNEKKWGNSIWICLSHPYRAAVVKNFSILKKIT